MMFRPHKGSMHEALEQVKEFETEREMKEYLVKDWQNHFDYDDIAIQDRPFEEQAIGWKDTRMVTVKRMGNENYEIPQCIGFCASHLE